ncbi:hypothetical protein [Gimesia aquarii]|uniref:Pseudopilin GspJ n=1 Tax=Gimesia aquarii TaxID=2527964 RepID=A0A517VR09_9PLAN|nr:hypothetical protein [Gimesia aquarii]QDT95458.1 hypothetical protein V144x_09010 [Gimesia aquarii]
MRKSFSSPKRRLVSLSLGFTLLEVILAIGLTTLLLAAIYSALDLYWKYTTIGHAQVERAQIARAIFQKITHDLHCVTYVQQITEEESTDSSEEEDEIEEIPVTNPDEAYTTANIGVYGDAQSLVLHTSRPARQPLLLSQSMSESDSTDSQSDLLSISYFIADAGSEGLQGVVGDRFRSATEYGVATQGLARLEGDRLAMINADESANLEELAEQSQLLAPEIDNLQFQYFDGTDWLEVWDSIEYGTVPQAVKVTIGFRNDDDQGVIKSINSKINGYENTYSMVIALPLALPAILQTSEQEADAF